MSKYDGKIYCYYPVPIPEQESQTLPILLFSEDLNNQNDNGCPDTYFLLEDGRLYKEVWQYNGKERSIIGKFVPCSGTLRTYSQYYDTEFGYDFWFKEGVVVKVIPNAGLYLDHFYPDDQDSGHEVELTVSLDWFYNKK